MVGLEEEIQRLFDERVEDVELLVKVLHHQIEEQVFAFFIFRVCKQLLRGKHLNYTFDCQLPQEDVFAHDILPDNQVIHILALLAEDSVNY